MTEFLQRRLSEISTKSAAELRSALEEAAQSDFRSEASDRAASLSLVLIQALKAFRASTARRLVEHAFTAVLAGGVAACAVISLTKL